MTTTGGLLARARSTRPVAGRWPSGLAALLGVVLAVPSLVGPTWLQTVSDRTRGELLSQQWQWSWGRVDLFGLTGVELDLVPNPVGLVVAVVLRTFSKAYGLAGLRVGYAVAHPPVAAALRKTATPFGVNSIAQVAAIASLDAIDELTERVDSLVAERERVVQALADQGWKLPRSDANFVWFPLGADSTAFTEACQEAGLMVRQYGDDGVRVTIGEADGNTRLIEVAEAFGAR